MQANPFLTSRLFQFIVLFAFIGLSLAAPTSNKEDTEATIIDGSETIAEYFIPSGYDYKFRTSNSIEKSEIADLAKNLVTGEYSYISPEDKYFLPFDFDYRNEKFLYFCT